MYNLHTAEIRRDGTVFCHSITFIQGHSRLSKLYQLKACIQFLLVVTSNLSLSTTISEIL